MFKTEKYNTPQQIQRKLICPFFMVICIRRWALQGVDQTSSTNILKQIIMKILLIVILFYATTALAFDPFYNPFTNIVSILRLKVYKKLNAHGSNTLDKSIAYCDVELLLKTDGTWEIISLKKAEATLDGDWSGVLAKSAGFGDNFWIGEIQLSVTQRGSSHIEGSEFYKFCTLNCVSKPKNNFTFIGSIANGEKILSLDIAIGKKILNFEGVSLRNFRKIEPFSNKNRDLPAIFISRDDRYRIAPPK